MASDALSGPELDTLAAAGCAVIEASVVRDGGSTFFLARRSGGDRVLGVLGDAAGFSGTLHEASGALLCAPTAAHAEALRARLPWLRPGHLGLATSAGFGDRLGLATPGHVRALRSTGGPAAAIAPIFAQQSVRENARTGRSPQQVMDDALWGLLAEGWRMPWGADADHLKTPADVEAFAAAGFSFYTIDPGDHVDDEAMPSRPTPCAARSTRCPGRPSRTASRTWRRDTSGDRSSSRAGRNRGPRALWRAAAKAARSRIPSAYRHILSRLGAGGFELEVSVDETASPTTVAEHLYIASELRRLGVRWVSLAPALSAPSRRAWTTSATWPRSSATSRGTPP
jgi:hypothetical protein